MNYTDMEKAAEVCFQSILTQSTRPLFVGVTGDSGSGKSYLTSLLAEKFEKHTQSFTVINHDEFLVARNEREPMKNSYYSDGKFAGKSHWEVLENMFRLDIYERVISDLRIGKKAHFFPYKRETGTVSDVERTVNPSDFILFDTSIMLDKMDFIILVDVTQENIIERKLVRDRDVRSAEQIEDMHRRVQGYYWEDRGRPKKADIIIDNNDFNNVKIIKA